MSRRTLVRVLQWEQRHAGPRTVPVDTGASSMPRLLAALADTLGLKAPPILVGGCAVLPVRSAPTPPACPHRTPQMSFGDQS